MLYLCRVLHQTTSSSLLTLLSNIQISYYSDFTIHNHTSTSRVSSPEDVTLVSQQPHWSHRCLAKIGGDRMKPCSINSELVTTWIGNHHICDSMQLEHATMALVSVYHAHFQIPCLIYYVLAFQLTEIIEIYPYLITFDSTKGHNKTQI